MRYANPWTVAHIHAKYPSCRSGTEPTGITPRELRISKSIRSSHLLPFFSLQDKFSTENDQSDPDSQEIDSC